MRVRRLLCLVAAALFGCAQPPSSAYVGGGGNKTATALGRDANGEACNQLPGDQPGSAEIFCGAWQQPAARVRGGPPGVSSVVSVATAGPWRAALNTRLICAAPVSTTVLDGQPAELLRCKRRIGGWPQVAVATRIDGRLWLADGILPTLPAMERSIGILSGRIPPTATTLPPSAADALLANQLAAHAFGADDVGNFEKLMRLGAQANLAENFASAEQAYRAALAIQQKALGRDNPDTADPLMHLALQISDQGRFAEAETLFQRAERLVARASDVVAPARLLHYRALHALNQGHDQRALALLRQAEAAYRALLPASVATGGVTQVSTGSSLPQGGATLGDPTTESALIGLIEARRYAAIVLRHLGQPQASAAEIAAAQSLANANRIALPVLAARLTRTAATTAAAAGESGVAESGLAHSAVAFNEALPETRPVAETMLLQAGELARLGQPQRAVALCATATRLLRKLQSGTQPALLAPCLGAYAAAVREQPEQAQTLRAAMFETAQLAQDSLTARQIAEAAARLAENARDPRVAQAIRRRQEAAQSLETLYRERDALQRGAAAGTIPPPAANPAELDKRIAAAQAEVADADSALQAAAPNYGQLVQDVVPASQVLAALRPDEAFVAITLTGNTGWEFVLRHGQIDAAPLPVGQEAVTALVRQIRASIEPGSAGLPRFDVTAAHTLYVDVLGPLAARLRGVKALIVAPTGPLLSLPFAVLLTGPADASHLSDAPWLIREMTIAHVPSAQNFVALRKIAATSRAREPWFGFGDFRPVTLAQAERSFPTSACADSARLFAGLPPLPFAARELTAARELLHGSPQDELLGAGFTVPAVMHADLKDFRVLHFAAHALLPTDLRCQPQPAIVTSAPPGAKDASGALLTTSKVLGLDLDADLVILSACNSGGPGGADAGDSLSGLARAFFFAGARALLVTHWSIADQSSAYLVADTLRRFAAGSDGGLAGSLRAAELGMIDGAGHTLPAELAHPFYWAPFALIGEGRGQPAPTHVASRGPASVVATESDVRAHP